MNGKITYIPGHNGYTSNQGSASAREPTTAFSLGYTIP